MRESSYLEWYQWGRVCEFAQLQNKPYEVSDLSSGGADVSLMTHCPFDATVGFVVRSLKAEINVKTHLISYDMMRVKSKHRHGDPCKPPSLIVTCKVLCEKSISGVALYKFKLFL